MSKDNGRVEALSQSIVTLAQDGDRNRLLIGSLLYRADRTYGTGLVSLVVKQTGMARSTLYDYLGVVKFFKRQRHSAGRILRENPNLYFSHLRAATRFKDWEIALDELIEASELGYSADRFSIEVKKKMGKSVPEPPIFSERGTFEQVLELARRSMSANGQHKTEVEITIRGIE